MIVFVEMVSLFINNGVFASSEILLFNKNSSDTWILENSTLVSLMKYFTLI